MLDQAGLIKRSGNVPLNVLKWTTLFAQSTHTRPPKHKGLVCVSPKDLGHNQAFHLLKGHSLLHWTQTIFILKRYSIQSGLAEHCFYCTVEHIGMN